MIALLGRMRSLLYAYRLRRRFPQSVIHHGATVDRDSVLGAHSVLFAGVRLTASGLGPYSYVQCDSMINYAEIGPFCSIAGGVIIGLGTHPLGMVSTNPVFYDPGQPLPKFFVKERLFTDIFLKTVVGADVWIGQRAMLKAGVSIGIGAVIGAGSIVTNDIPPYTIAAGNPCRPIRLRFPEHVCNELLETQWWTFDESRLIKMAPLFSDPLSFLAAVSKRDD